MEITTVVRKRWPKLVMRMLVRELDKSKCSTKFLSHNFDDEMVVYVKCFEDGTIDLRGNTKEYRIVKPD